MPDASVIANEPQGHVASDVGDVAIRTLATTGDFRACVTLQREIWGREFEDIVPASLLHVATHVGGVALGAFDAERLVGFVFGLAGEVSGERVHWSHMLGVAEGARDRGIGRRLKEQQRLVLARRGIAKMYWTFDPLQARNAHLNLTRLGVHVVDYVADMYGPMGSPLHHGLATDRLIVMCHTVPALTDHARRAFPGLATLEGAPVLSAAPRAHDRRLESTGDEPPVALIEIPADLPQVVQASPESAAEWRLATRAHFQWAFGRGYQVAGFRRDAVTARSFYVLTRSHTHEDMV